MYLADYTELATIHGNITFSRTEHMFPGLDGMVGYNHAKEIAEVEKTCAALAAACEDKTEDGNKST